MFTCLHVCACTYAHPYANTLASSVGNGSSVLCPNDAHQALYSLPSLCFYCCVCLWYCDTYVHQSVAQYWEADNWSFLILSCGSFVLQLVAGLAGLAITNALSVTGLLNWAVRCYAETETMMNSVEVHTRHILYHYRSGYCTIGYMRWIYAHRRQWTLSCAGVTLTQRPWWTT